MRTWLLTLGLLLACAGLPQARTQTGWKALAPGLEYRAVGAPGQEASWMHQLRLDPARCRLGLLLAGKRKALPIADLVAGTKALAAVNAGYFDENAQPLGYLRDGARVINDQLATGAAFTGIFWIGPEGARVGLREDFHPGSERFAIQCGPRLVTGGQAVGGLRANQPRRRTGLGVDRQGRILLFATALNGLLTFEECQKQLLAPEDKGGMAPLAMLNLDGGSSTQMAVRAGQTQVTLLGYNPVPVALAVFSR